MSIAPTREHIIADNVTVSDLLKVAPQSMTAQDGTVALSGIDLLDIAQEFGTALYVYDEAHIRAQLHTFLQAMRNNYAESDIVYAAKAFCSVAMDRIVAEEGCGIDTAGGGELAIAQAASFPMSKVFMQGNNKSEKEIREAIHAGVSCFVVDTIEELRRINGIAKNHNHIQKIFIRICPGIEADTHSYIQTANEDSKFGFNIRNGAAEQAILEAMNLSNLDLKGVHCHIGSQIFELSSYDRAAMVMIAFLDTMRQKHGFIARELDMGGGLGIPYTIYDKASSIEEFAKTICGAVKKYCARHEYPLPHLYVEPGRSIVANAGITLYTVGSVKEVPGICTYVAVDGGMTDNIRTALYGSKYEAFVVNHAFEPRNTICDIVGKHCESGDCVVKNSALQRCKAGDVVCVLGTGAYCNEMASNYNKQVRPGIVMVKDGSARLIVRRETYGDLLARDIY